MNPTHIQCRVAVVGAGISGLVAARALVAAGADPVVVLEARDRVGGRTVNAPTRTGAVAEGGGQWVGRSQTRVLALLRELEIGTFETYFYGTHRYRFMGFTLSEEDVADEDDRAEVERLAGMLDRLAAEVSTTAPWAAARAGEWDRMTVRDWVSAEARRSGAGEEIELGAAFALSAPADRVSMLFFLFYLRSAGGWHAMEDVRGGAQDLRVEGGAHRISHALALGLERRVQLASPVTRIRHADHGVRVESARYTVDAERVIVATMPADLRRVAFDPPLPPQRQGLIAGWTGAHGLKASVVYARPFWRAQGWSGHAIGDGVVQATFDNSPSGAEHGVLLVFAEPGDLPDDASDRREAILDGLSDLFGDEAEHPIDYAETDWSRDPWSSGCVSPLGPGVLTRVGPALRASVGRIHWAGTETATEWMGYMDGAVRAGESAAAEVLRALRG